MTSRSKKIATVAKEAACWVRYGKAWYAGDPESRKIWEKCIHNVRGGVFAGANLLNPQRIKIEVAGSLVSFLYKDDADLDALLEKEQFLDSLCNDHTVTFKKNK